MIYTTSQLNINLVRPLTVQTGPVWCTAEIIHAGRRVATAEAKVSDDQDKLYAHGTTTCVIIQPDRMNGE